MKSSVFAASNIASLRVATVSIARKRFGWPASNKARHDEPDAAVSARPKKGRHQTP
jgi:hypothetical protein